ncbi:MAG: hypothetical protein V3V00_08430 [Saprospiraceae bacterium]
MIKEIKKKRTLWPYGEATQEVKNLLFSSFLRIDMFLFPLKSDILVIPVKHGKVDTLTDRIIKHVKKRNKKLRVWMYEGKYVETIETKSQYEVLKTRGVDGVFTDCPERLFRDLSYCYAPELYK